MTFKIKWYQIPFMLYLLFVLFWIGIPYLYIQPHYIQTVETLNIQSNKVLIKSQDIKGPNNRTSIEYNIISMPHNRLNENYITGTGYMFAPVGILIGNFDFDKEKEILVITESGPYKTKISNIKLNKQKFFHDGQFAGYYDFRQEKFQFLPLRDTPFSMLINDWYVKDNLYLEIFGFGFISLILSIGLKIINYLINKFKVKNLP